MHLNCLNFLFLNQPKGPYYFRRGIYALKVTRNIVQRNVVNVHGSVVLSKIMLLRSREMLIIFWVMLLMSNGMLWMSYIVVSIHVMGKNWFNIYWHTLNIFGKNVFLKKGLSLFLIKLLLHVLHLIGARAFNLNVINGIKPEMFHLYWKVISYFHTKDKPWPEHINLNSLNICYFEVHPLEILYFFVFLAL